MISKPVIRIAYADSYVLVRKGIIALLSNFPDLSVDIEADNGSELINQIADSTQVPDVCILDIRMQETYGFDILAALKKK